MRLLPFALATLLLASVALAGPAAAPSPAAQDGPVVAGVMYQWVPPVVVVPAGTPVTWLGVLLPHTVTTAASLEDALASAPNEPPGGDADPDTFNVPLEVGDSFAHAFAARGAYWYVCLIHAGQVGLVVVV